MLDKTDKFLDIFMSLIFIISVIMMITSIIIIILILIRNNRYNQIEEIEENINDDNESEDKENDYNKNDPLISDDNYPVSILDKNSAIKSGIKYNSNNNNNSPSTGVFTFNEPKKRNIYGNEYIEIHSNEIEDIDKINSGRLNSENHKRKNSNKFDKFIEI
jgi:hypothetical protein